ncbi:hypothetical protein D3C76_1231860 [compost metagenome]
MREGVALPEQTSQVVLGVDGVGHFSWAGRLHQRVVRAVSCLQCFEDVVLYPPTSCYTAIAVIVAHIDVVTEATTVA